MLHQFIHLGAYGVKPRAGDAQWSCVECITQEGARVPKASRHIAYREEPRILHGVSPIEAGRRGIELAPLARDARGRRRPPSGVVLIAGVASYPIPRKSVDKDPVDQDVYGNWRLMTCDWLKDTFDEYLTSVVEHIDEEYLHIHFYLVPRLLSDGRLDLPNFHPGRAMKAAAADAGASKKNQDAAYRRGMERWQDDYHYSVGRFFGHERYGPRRARVFRLERKAQLRIDAADERARAEREAARAEAQRKRNEADARMRERCVVMEENARRRGWEAYAQPYADLRAGFDLLMRDFGNERARREAAEADAAALRAQLAAIEEEAGTVMAVR